jgi:hypothetical protein
MPFKLISNAEAANKISEAARLNSVQKQNLLDALNQGELTLKILGHKPLETTFLWRLSSIPLFLLFLLLAISGPIKFILTGSSRYDMKKFGWARTWASKVFEGYE